jgi:hypothetical protein
VTRLHTALIIAGFVLLTGSACGLAQRVVAVQPTPRKAALPLRTLVPTFTPSPEWTATPTVTNTPTETPTPTVTSTPLPTATPESTDTPKPTKVPKPTVPTETPTTAATATPALDFVVTKQDVMPIIVNGSCNWRQNIFVDVVDANNTPIDGLIVSDKYNNLTHVTGDKGPGKVVFDLWKNSLELFVKSDQAGKPLRSQTTRRLSSDQPEISDMIKGGVCQNEAECQAKIASNSFCWGHYAYEVTFKRTY